MIFFKLTIILIMLFFGISFIKGALCNRKQLYYPKASWMLELANGVTFIIWAATMIILEFI